MSSDLRDAGSDDSTRVANPVDVPAAGDPAKKYPPGVVLGKDGKPCRSCTSGAAFAAWSSSMKSPGTQKASSSTPSQATATGTPTSSSTRAGCPADVEQLGNSTWTLLHTIAASYPETPSATQKEDLRGFMRTFSRLYPCWVCAEDFQAYQQKDQVKVNGRAEFGNWLCEAHNEVNRKLGKKEFDCSRWEERWRTGWKDGRCD